MSKGSTGNVIAALASFFIPGLGQLVQGRVLAVIVMVLIYGLLWLLAAISFGILGFLPAIGHIIAALDCAVWKPRT